MLDDVEFLKETLNGEFHQEKRFLMSVIFFFSNFGLGSDASVGGSHLAGGHPHVDFVDTPSKPL